MDLNQYFSKGFTRAEYLIKIQNQLDELIASGDEKNYAQYYQINLKRIERLDKTFELNEAQFTALNSKDPNFRVIVITEGWCGDAAQVEPVVAKILDKLNVQSRYLLRDENPELMDLYLTDSAKSIPIFVGINEQGEEIFRFGPRPQHGMDLLHRHKNNPEVYTADQFHSDLQIWYNHDKGKSIVEEFLNQLK